MGKHEPQNPPVDEHLHEATADYAATHTAPADTPPGPRRAAARARKKRTLLVASAAGLTLVVGGGAAAAVITSGIDPDEATTAVGIPDAQPDPLTASTEADDPDPHLREQVDQARSQATQSRSATASAILEEPEPEQDEEPDPTTDSSTDSDEGTGQGGTCQASFYGDGFHGATTANGETFDTQAMTAAHKTLPFDTMVKVTNPNNGQSVTVRINDRGPYIDGRCLDLSTAAFDQIIGTGSGVGTVAWEVVG